MLYPVTFVSLGPGDPELITLKGLKKLEEADIIFSPSTQGKNGLYLSRAKNILLELGINESKIRLFDVPMNKDRSLAIESYKAVAEKIADEHSKNVKIAVTAEGDAGFYSSIYYIAEYLEKHLVPLERIAGVPAFIACGTLSNIHIVKQEEKLLVIPGIITAEEIEDYLNRNMNLVIMKTSQCEADIKESITKLENVTFHYFENAGIIGKEFYTQKTQDILTRKFPYFSLLIIQNNLSE